MKYIILLLLFLLPVAAFSEWNLVYDYDDWGFTMHVINKDTVVVAGAVDGKIHRTTDGGESWSVYQTIFKQSQFLDIDFPTPSVGYAVGGSAFGTHKEIIAKTTNGGLTWDSLTSNAFGGYNFTKVYFVNELIGFIAREGSQGMLVTTDGGVTFTPAPIPVTVNDMLFTKNLQGFIAVTDYLSVPEMNVYSIQKSVDFGKSWTSVYSDTTAKDNSAKFGDVLKLFFINNVGYAVGNMGLILKTTDYGETWTKKTPPPPQSRLTGLFFTSENTGYINNFYSIFKTTDGGDTWEEQIVNQLGSINEIEFADAQIGYAVGVDAVYKTVNAGEPTNVNDESDKTNLLFYPNPSKDFLYFKNNSGEINSVKIYNYLGQTVKEFNNGLGKIDITDLPSGFYMIQTEKGNKKSVQNFIKE